MSVRNKSRRRLVILLVAAVSGVAVLGGSYGGLKLYRRHQAWVARGDGFAAYDAGDYRKALDKLGQNLSRYPARSDDPDSLKALEEYAIAREKVEEGNGSHRTGALDAWRNYVAVKPDDLRANRKILELYPYMGNRLIVEAEEAANRVLAQDKQDRAALLALARIRYESRKEGKTGDPVPNPLAALLAKDPLDIEARLLDMQRQLEREHKTPQEVVSSLETLLKPEVGRPAVNPADPRYQLLLARAYAIAGDGRSSMEATEKAAVADIPDATWLQQIVQQLDMLGQFPRSLELCRKAAEAHPQDRDIQQYLTHRLFLAGDFDAVCARLDALKAEDTSVSGDQLAIKAWALLSRKDPSAEHLAEARAIVAALIKRGTEDRGGFALASALRAAWPDRLVGPDAPLADPVSDARQAVALVPGSGFTRYLLAQTLLAASDSQGAIAQLKTLLESPGMRSWGSPRFLAARVYLKKAETENASSGAAGDAALLAEAGLNCAPGNPEGQVLKLVADALSVTKTEDIGRLRKQPVAADAARKQREDLLTKCAALEDQFPKAQELWTARADLLARLGLRDDAITYIHKKIKASPSRDILLAFASTSSQLSLGVEEECYAACETSHGLSPELVGARAGYLFANNKKEDGLAYVKASAQGKKEPLWRVLHARFLDAMNDPAAKALWAEIGDAFPEDLRVQRAILNSPTADHDDVQRKVFTRVRKIAEPGDDLEVAYARWLIDEWRQNKNKNSNASDEQLVEATKILSELTRSQSADPGLRLLLADCMQQLKNTAGAVEQLRILVLQPDTFYPAASIRLAEIELGRSNVGEARAQLQRLVDGMSALPGGLKDGLTICTNAQRLRLIELLRQVGDVPRATAAAAASGDSPEVGVALAQSYANSGDLQKANRELDRLLEKPTPVVIDFAVRYYGATGQQPAAETALAKLDTIEAAPGVKEYIRAEYYAARSDFDKAAAQYLAAARVKFPNDNPTQAQRDAKAGVWRQLLALTYAVGKKEDFGAYVDEALKMTPDDEGLKALKDSYELMYSIPANYAERQLGVSLLRIREDNGTLAEVLPFLREAGQKAKDFADRKAPPSAAEVTEARNRMITKLNALADKKDKLLALQKLAVETDSALGDHDAALRLATRATQVFPSDPDAWELAFRAQLKAGRYEEALRSAQEWRSRAALKPMEADVAVATAANALGRSDTVIDSLKPYVEPTLKAAEAGSGQVNGDVLLLYCRATISKGQHAQIQKILEPLLKTPGGRDLSLRLAPTVRDRQAAAAWIKGVADVIPADAPAEQVGVARAWFELHRATSTPDYANRAITALNTLLDRDKLESPALSVAGMLYESLNHAAEAEKAYRRAIALEPKSPADKNAVVIALNNLAMILSRRPNGLSEALELQTRVVELVPANANFLDTLATLCVLAGQYDKALDSIDKAIKLEERNQDWRVAKLWILHRAGRKDDLRKEQAAFVVNDRQPLSDDSRQRLKEIAQSPTR